MEKTFSLVTTSGARFHQPYKTAAWVAPQEIFIFEWELQHGMDGRTIASANLRTTPCSSMA
jgi:hypothetical protein